MKRFRTERSVFSKSHCPVGMETSPSLGQQLYFGPDHFLRCMWYLYTDKLIPYRPAVETLFSSSTASAASWATAGCATCHALYSREHTKTFRWRHPNFLSTLRFRLYQWKTCRSLVNYPQLDCTLAVRAFKHHKFETSKILKCPKVLWVLERPDSRSSRSEDSSSADSSAC